ncbi:MAG: histone-like protein [Candidatus Micrarchaeaceae archaeon]|jgi:histone H3/H4
MHNKISKASIKKLIKNSSNPNIIISDKAADAIAALLEKKAQRIAKYAVNRAKSKKRATITEDDIDTYRLKFGD